MVPSLLDIAIAWPGELPVMDSTLYYLQQLCSILYKLVVAKHQLLTLWLTHCTYSALGHTIFRVEPIKVKINLKVWLELNEPDVTQVQLLPLFPSVYLMNSHYYAVFTDLARAAHTWVLSFGRWRWRSVLDTRKELPVQTSPVHGTWTS